MSLVERVSDHAQRQLAQMWDLWVNRATALGVDEKAIVRAQDPSHAGNARFCSLSALETESGAILVVMVLAVLIYLVKCLLVPLCNWVYWWRMGDSGSERQARKFRELAWYTLYYVVALTAAISVVVHETYDFWRSVELWSNWPMHPFSIYFRMYYIFELAFYVQALVAIFLEERTDDFWILVTHHIATIFLVFGSYLGRFHRCGLLILMLHDISDIFLYGAKAVNCLQLKGTKDLCTIVFAISFFVCRLILFPIFAIYSSTFESIVVIDNHAFFIFPNMSLILLFIMHCYWWILIVKIGYRKLKGEEIQDIREGDSYDRAVKDKAAKLPQQELELLRAQRQQEKLEQAEEVVAAGKRMAERNSGRRRRQDAAAGLGRVPFIRQQQQQQQQPNAQQAGGAQLD